MQEIIFNEGERITLSSLRRKHFDEGMSGECIARIHPTLYTSAFEAVNFISVDHYQKMGKVKIDENEIGCAELFRIVLSAPARYCKTDFSL